MHGPCHCMWWSSSLCNNSLRRSSRLTTNKYRTPPKEGSRSKSRSKKLLSLVLSPLRRSPSSAPALTFMDVDNVGPGEAKRRRLSEDKGAARRVGKKVKVGSNEGSLRRSSRLSGGKNGNSSPLLLTWPEHGSKLSEKSLRSRTVTMDVGDVKEKSYSNKNNGDLSAQEKCLTTPKMESSLDAEVKSERKQKSIECCFIGEPIPPEVAQEKW